MNQDNRLFVFSWNLFNFLHVVDPLLKTANWFSLFLTKTSLNTQWFDSFLITEKIRGFSGFFGVGVGVIGKNFRVRGRVRDQRKKIFGFRGEKLCPRWSLVDSFLLYHRLIWKKNETSWKVESIQLELNLEDNMTVFRSKRMWVIWSIALSLY